MQSNSSDLSQPERTKVVDFLDSHPIGVLATVDADGNPNASTIYFTVTHDFLITFTTKRDTRKHDNIGRNNKVVLVVYDAESQSAVQITGQAVEVKDQEQIERIYHGTLRAAKLTAEDNVPPVAKISAGPYVAYSLKPEVITMSEYGWGDSFAKAILQTTVPISNEDPA